jgi:hypothetical protein
MLYCVESTVFPGHIYSGGNNKKRNVIYMEKYIEGYGASKTWYNLAYWFRRVCRCV